jgi:predicted enzyme related to lactoylglutathione lyase
MSEVGKVTWFDLTVPHADRLRDFYHDVVGWKVGEVKMESYCDYVMKTPGGESVAGVCHAQGVNANIPPQWLIYINVANLNQSIEKCKALGGTVIEGPRDMGGYGSMVIIRDPAGAVCALIEPPAN